jgi:hypothetical protein
LIAEVNPRVFQRSPSAMDDFMLPQPGLSPIRGKPVVARFDEGCTFTAAILATALSTSFRAASMAHGRPAA